MSGSSDQQLAAAAARFREALDMGRLSRREVRAALTEHAHGLLRMYPADAGLWRAFETLRDRQFDPPASPELPGGSFLEMSAALDAKTPEELRLVSGAILTPPAPGDSLKDVERVLALWARIPEENERAQALLEQAKPYLGEAAAALWNLQLALCGRQEALSEQEGQTLLAPFRRLEGADSVYLARALRRCAAAAVTHSEHAEDNWLVPISAGISVINARLAELRSPALRDRAQVVYRWLDEAWEVDPDDRHWASNMERKDREGDIEGASRILKEVIARFPDQTGLVQAVAARATLLHDAELAALAVELEPHICDVGTITRRSGLQVEPEQLPSTVPPPSGWTQRIDRVGQLQSALEPSDWAFIEAAGSLKRAATGWLEQEGDEALLEACRLREALSHEQTESLIARLESRVIREPGVLRDEPVERILASHYYRLLPEGPQRTGLGLSLRGIWPLPPLSLVATQEAEQMDASEADTPHRLEDRIAAADDLVSEGHMDAAATVLASIFRRDLAADQCKLVAAVVRQALRDADPPLTLIEAVSKTIRQGSALGHVLVDVLVDDPRAAHPFHVVLPELALQSDFSDAIRVRLLRAWIGIWAASSTPPPARVVRHFMSGQDAGLLPLAALAVGGSQDPVKAASTFLQAHPPATTTAADWAREIVDLAISNAPKNTGETSGA